LQDALNVFIVIDENKQKIVNAEALPLYVQLLDPKWGEKLNAAAAKGIWILAFKCKDSINDEPGCLDGRYLSTAIQHYS